MALAPDQSNLILWDVIEEHLDEAEFLFERWNRALFEPVFDLDGLARTLEPRLFAHIDALVIGSAKVADRTLLPALFSAETPSRATAAALALLAEPQGTWVDAVLKAVLQTKPELQAALVRACILSDATNLDVMARKRFAASPANPHLLQILTGRGLDPGHFLRASLESRDPATVEAGRKAVQRFGRRDLYSLAKIRPDKPSVPSGREWKDRLQQPETMEAALWSLGFCGTVEAGDACTPYLTHANLRLRKLAADSLAWIGGFSLFAARFKLAARDAVPAASVSLPSFEEDDPAAKFELDGVEALPIPNADAIQQWWQTHRGGLSWSGRCLLGEPFSPASARRALRNGVLWRRHALALELSHQTEGREHVATDAFSSRQIQQIAAMVA